MSLGSPFQRSRRALREQRRLQLPCSGQARSEPRQRQPGQQRRREPRSPRVLPIQHPEKRESRGANLDRYAPGTRTALPRQCGNRAGGQPRPAAPAPHADGGCQREQLRGLRDRPPGLRGAHPPRASFPASLPTSFLAPAPLPAPPPASERGGGAPCAGAPGRACPVQRTAGGWPSPPLRPPGRARRCPRLPPPPAPPGRWERRQLPLKSARRPGDDATQLSPGALRTGSVGSSGSPAARV
ncbi:basic proline-rich protein-like [Melospiza melodia melodia]|uniref:basic proline-rich protein-like n=1 Tax=Melospiza melodia melodia TaxID=1914991 RepID=UPI002FD4C726